MNQTPPKRTVQSRKRRSQKKRVNILNVVLFAVLIAAVVGGGFFIYAYSTSTTIRDSLGAILSNSDSPEKAFPGHNEVNVLFLGRDLDRDNRGQIVHTRGRTDCIMLAHINFPERSVKILSIPRDTLVRIPGYRGKHKINSANAFGGPELTSETVENLLGVSPHHYMLVNFDGFEKAIDKLGGLVVTVDKQLDYDDNWGNLHIHLKPGRQLLNGDQAIGFARYRHANGGGGDSDFVRIGRQQELLRAFRTKLTSPGTLMRMPGILDSVQEDMETDLTPAQTLCLARFIKSIQSESGITMETLPAEEGRIYVRADLDATRDLVNRMFFDGQQ